MGDVSSRTNEFLPSFHCPDSLFSMTSTSLVFWVAIAFSAVHAPPAIPSVKTSAVTTRSEEHTSELQSLAYLVCRLLLEKKKKIKKRKYSTSLLYSNDNTGHR